MVLSRAVSSKSHHRLFIDGSEIGLKFKMAGLGIVEIAEHGVRPCHCLRMMRLFPESGFCFVAGGTVGCSFARIWSFFRRSSSGRLSGRLSGRFSSRFSECLGHESKCKDAVRENFQQGFGHRGSLIQALID